MEWKIITKIKKAQNEKPNLQLVRAKINTTASAMPLARAHKVAPSINPTKINYKMKNLIYISSLILIGISIFLMLEYPNSGKMSLIAGAMTFLGFALNINGYLQNKN